MNLPPFEKWLSAVYLHVPFSEKDACKALGARWDQEERQWYMSSPVFELTL